MKVFRKIFGFVSLILSLVLCFQSATFAYGMEIYDISRLCDEIPTFRVSYFCHEENGLVDLCGVLGDCTIRCEKFGHYAVENSERTICRIVEKNASSYIMKLVDPIPERSVEWKIEKPDGCSYWELTSVSCEYRIYINKVPDSDAWIIEKQVISHEETKTEEIAIIDFVPEIYGEIIDLVNFIISVTMCSNVCGANHCF